MLKPSQCQSLKRLRDQDEDGLVTFYDAYQLLFQRLLSVGLLRTREAEADENKRVDDEAPRLNLEQHKTSATSRYTETNGNHWSEPYV